MTEEGKYIKQFFDLGAGSRVNVLPSPGMTALSSFRKSRSDYPESMTEEGKYTKQFFDLDTGSRVNVLPSPGMTKEVLIDWMLAFASMTEKEARHDGSIVIPEITK